MNKQELKDLDRTATINFECTDDPRLNYTFMKKDFIENFQENPELVYAEKLDYGLIIKEKH